MNKLTAAELAVLNNMSKVLNPAVLLGDKLQEIIGASGETGSPVNAVAAKETLSITGVSIDGETFTIGTDVYEFLADAAQSKTFPKNIGIDITAKTVKASGALTIDTQPTSGDTLTIGAKTYIFVPTGTANSAGEISIGADLATAQAAIVAAINGTDGHNNPNPDVTASEFVANVCTITALIGGTIGNVIPTTETFTTATNVFAAATLGSGTNCTAVNTVAAIIVAINANDTQGVTATAGEGNTIVLTADVAGVLGNGIGLSTTMANASFTAGAVNLSGGIDGTIANGMKFMIDETYLYVCLNGNTKSETNWRRVALGVAY
jgi:hypothetical protein